VRGLLYSKNTSPTVYSSRPNIGIMRSPLLSDVVRNCMYRYENSLNKASAIEGHMVFGMACRRKGVEPKPTYTEHMYLICIKPMV
jgi:hypothetical protein